MPNSKVINLARLQNYDAQRRAHLATELRELEKNLETKFICVFNITAANTPVTFNITGKSSVDWGDGSINTDGPGMASHTYANPGEYICIISSESSLTLNQDAFKDCSALKQVIIRSTSAVSHGAFSGCTNLESAVVGDSVTSIKDYAFKDCSSLNTITVNATNATLASSALSVTLINLTKIIVPIDYVDAYKTKTNWAQFADKIIGIVDTKYLKEKIGQTKTELEAADAANKTELLGKIATLEAALTNVNNFIGGDSSVDYTGFSTLFQTRIDDALETTSNEVVGAINELNSQISDLDLEFFGLLYN